MNLRRVALITGGSSGIGAACVRKLLTLDWAVSVVALPGPELDRIAGPGTLVTSGDITLREIRELAVKRTLQRRGRIDVFINCAGVGLYAAPTEVSIPLFSRVLDVNVLAPLALAQMVVPGMRKQGGGSIVNISSVAGFVALPWAAAYSASKFALDSVHDSLRRELRGGCIHVLKVCPGIVDTDFRDHVLAGTAPTSVRSIRRVVSADAVAGAILSAIHHRRHTIYVPRLGRLFALAGSVAPRLMDAYLSRFLPAAASVDRGRNACEYDSNELGWAEASPPPVGD
jgi:short-subunit dehydrogenase